ncbi:ubiquitin carboxyl-terminal hydrolase-like [Bradysia coprophila]|uniref:ubiquitin carboxyl-terminal hydrolase-like n=1 Tax=Bradysia coprophila TaxID=38358 RepID=UPI00187DD01C|nr:ubiquitin carboxyl-terminal hydrolase-like [Bradysia coprophila]
MSSWIPLQSNPEILSAYLRKLGVPRGWNIVDVLGLDEELLNQVPRPVAALILLFPLSEKYEQHRSAEDEKLKANTPVYPNDLFYMKQTINNACGTCALIHAVSNNKEIVLKDGILKKFLNSARDLTAEERGKLLEVNTDFMHTMNTHPLPASEESSETSSDGVDLHFVAFIEKDGELYELDGLKSFPIKHGPTTKENFLKDAAKVCKEFMARDPNELRFTVSAITYAKVEKMKEQCSILN